MKKPQEARERARVRAEIVFDSRRACRSVPDDNGVLAQCFDPDCVDCTVLQIVDHLRATMPHARCIDARLVHEDDVGDEIAIDAADISTPTSQSTRRRTRTLAK